MDEALVGDTTDTQVPPTTPATSSKKGHSQESARETRGIEYPKEDMNPDDIPF